MTWSSTFVIVSMGMLLLVYWQRGWRELYVAGRNSVLIGLAGGGLVLLVQHSVQDCHQLRSVTAKEQAMIEMATRLLCTVQHSYPRELSDPVCSLLQRGTVQFVTQRRLPFFPLRHWCFLGETTPMAEAASDRVMPQVTHQIAIRRDQLQSLASTFVTLAHEGTHATSTPQRYHFAAEQYQYERCLDENTVRDKVAVWGTRASQFLRSLSDIPPPWLGATHEGVSTPQIETTSWAQVRETLMAEIVAASRQDRWWASNRHKYCSEEQQEKETEKQ